jgi:hypothetical protein
MAYYERLGDVYVACSSYGIAGSLPSLSNKMLHEAKSTGYAYFQDQKSPVIHLFDGHVLLIPESTQLPPELLNEIQRIGSFSIFSSGKFRLYPYDKLGKNSVHELIHLGLSRNFLYGSFFRLNTDILTSKATALCPLAIPELISNELRSMVLGVLGSSGHAVGMHNNACFCVFYSHTVIDTELIVTQVGRTLLRSLPLKDTGISVTGPWYSAKLSEEHSESGLSSFIDSVVPRLEV